MSSTHTRHHLGAEDPDWKRIALVRRVILGAIVSAQTALATFAMVQVLPYHGGDMLEICLASVFCLLFFGISIGFWLALYGFILRRSGGDRYSLMGQHPDERLRAIAPARTAVVMPIYHEPVDRTFAGMEAIYSSLAQTGYLEYFDFYILSDSRDPEFWLAEQAAWYGLCKKLTADGRLFYRRRTVNLKYKSGNIADFLRRWGKNYRYFLVLDADSLMAGETIVKMVRLMEAEPQVGILQSCPTLVNAVTPYARVQQFAGQLFGPLFASGLAALQLGEAAYWGHNALLRTEPFMAHCGLRKLKGRGLFGGAIMSHDFVEAAYIARAGYEVWLEPGLDHSHEETPPTLIEDLVRDRRWARGNLQHLSLLFGERRLRFAHRLAFVHGIMSYLSSPLWLLFLLLSSWEAARLILQPINYFPRPYSLSPLWPEWHPDLAVTLVTSTLVLLFLPKMLAVVDVLCSGRTRDFGGFLPLTISLLIECLTSMVLAPIRMLAHSRFVTEPLLNIRLQWAGQNRTDETTWKTTFLSQLPGTLLAGCWLIFTTTLDLNTLLWSLPVALPLLLATPISMLLGRKRLGRWLERHQLLTVSTERHGSHVLFRMAEDPSNETQSREITHFEETLIDTSMNALQQALARNLERGARTTVLQRLRNQCLAQGPAALTTGERSLLARDRESLKWLHQAIWQAEQNSHWWRQLNRRLFR